MHGEGNGNWEGNVKVGSVTAELEETKQRLQKAKEESMEMATCVSSLKQELEKTKEELHQLRKQVMESEIEEVKIVQQDDDDDDDDNNNGREFQKKRYVTFANPPSLEQVMLPQHFQKLERHPSLRDKIKKKKKPLIPLIGAIFFKKKETSSSSQLI